MFLLIGFILLQGCSSPDPKKSETIRCDLLVYGGTPAGVCAARAAEEQGLSVVVVEPTGHLGGMMSSGLCNSDKANHRVIGGLGLQVFQRIGNHYRDDLAWKFEPHVAKKIFDEMIVHPNITVVHRQRVEKVIKEEQQITTVLFTRGLTVDASMYIDATYEGDLMARAGISYTIGRESDETYGGVQELSEENQWAGSISARDKKGRLFPEIQDVPMSKPGGGDRKVQAYNFRVCLTDTKKNQIKIKKPRGYRSKRYTLLAHHLETHPTLQLHDLIKLFQLPNQKYDINSNGPFSTDYLGGSWDYPDADYELRKKIWIDHQRYTQGLFYFLGHDKRVPSHIRKDMKRYGYAKDEFKDNHHWPYQLYVREGRRMKGAFILTEQDVIKRLEKADNIGMGSHYIESHHIQRFMSPDGYVQNRGLVRTRGKVRPYQIPYRSITPQKTECANLLVPVCLSASHIAYCSLRMEPQYMILGHSAGVAAAHALHSNRAVQDVDIAALQSALKEQGQVLAY